MTIQEFIKFALEEDIRDGDHTALSTIPASAKGRAQLLVKEDGILAGVELAQQIFDIYDPQIKMDILIPDGAPVRVGDVAFKVFGSSRSLLTSERLVLNFMQRMSGIATMTGRFVEALDESRIQILDTRKTSPGLRQFEKWAVRIGGGQNHRMGLYDMIMIKDNHVDFAGGIPQAIDNVKNYLQEKNILLKVEIETRNLEEVKQVLAHGGVDRIMLDNFSVENINKAVDLIDGQFETEVSGNVSLDNIHIYKNCKVDFISTGAVTHSAGSMDLSLKAF